MPVLTHEQLHQLLAGLASLQKLNGDVFAQTEFTRGKFSHSHYVAALHKATFWARVSRRIAASRFSALPRSDATSW